MTRSPLPSIPDRPPANLLFAQAAWLAPARSRMLRRVAVAHRRRVLDLGAAKGAVTEDLIRRTRGRVAAVDRNYQVLAEWPPDLARADRVQAEAENLPFAQQSFDLVFTQCALMWMDLPRVLPEIRRILAPGGVLLALEPDFGGLIEHPPEVSTQDLWRAGLTRAGADPLTGRRLPGLLHGLGFSVRVDLISELHPPSPLRFEMLRGLPMSRQEKEVLAGIERSDAEMNRLGQQVVAHLPFFLVTAGREG